MGGWTRKPAGVDSSQQERRKPLRREAVMMHRAFSKMLLAFLVVGISVAVRTAESPAIRTPATNDVVSLALSPDGLTLAVAGRYNGRTHLWLKPVGNGEARPLEGTADAVYPFWSPDGSKLGFFAEDQIRQIDIRSGKVTTLEAGLGFPAGGSWNKDGTILFSSHGRNVIWQMPETGGTPTQVATLDGPDQYTLVHPHLLPDGVNFLYYTHGKPQERGVYQGILGSRVTRRLVDSEAAAVYAAGKLYFVQNGTLHALSFDPALGILGNDDEIIARDVPRGNRSAVALASNGTRVAYRTGTAGSKRQLTWYDRTGRQLGTVGAPFDAGNSAPSLSPDGKSVVINYLTDGFGDIGVVDLETGKGTVVSDNVANDMAPIWSSDGASVLFSSKRTSLIEAYRQAVGMPAAPGKVFSTVDLRHPMDMSRDGRYLFYRKNTPDLWVLDQRTGEEISILPPGSPRTHWPQVSPDGRWIAFQSDVSGSTQIHLHGPFAPPSLGTTSQPISSNGGGWPRWRGDGKELFYTEADGTIMAISLAFAADGRSFIAAAPVRLFNAPMYASPKNYTIAQQYMVSADGQRFLVISAPDAQSPVHLRAP
jgi:Tol biopolymer transport system component